MRRYLAAAAVPVLTALLVAGCSSSSPPKVHKPTVGTGVAHTGSVGASIKVTTKTGRDLQVTLTSVIDPATGAKGATPKAGERFVGAELTIDNVSSASTSPDARTDLVAIGSDFKPFVPLHTPITECPPFTTGHFKLSSGMSATGCVTFEVPTGVIVEKVEFLPTGGTAGDYAEWSIP
jgi:hypothetical protein